ncbi:Glycoside Hydrolase Family 63 protein [Trametes cinnabarina]|uniref:Mannosyl-oligosaccharide glucosidase n=1 Tax=Pycnoporus cinnabarinus TaxID=5643 RepID=A0A060SQS8_PYCCI|nr:Glycoside Hydrolase Family 63 protein [Trametes cinnabarina]
MRLLWLLLPLAPSVFAQPGNDSESLLWGAYRPQLYFGLRPRLPQSVMTGLAWFGTQDFQSITRMRHACDQGDGLNSYTWTEYDARQGGEQVIKDGINNVVITTQFLKVPGGVHGGSWAARIKGEPMNPAYPSRISPVFYVGLEGLGGIDMDTEEDENGIEGTVSFSGSTPELDDFTIRIVEGPSNIWITEGSHASAFQQRLGKTHFLGARVPPGQVWQAKDLIQGAIVKSAQEAIAPYKDAAKGYPDPAFIYQLPDEVYTGSNLYAVQKHYDGPFQFDVFFDSASAKQKLSSSVLDEGIPALLAEYNERFNEVFPIPSTYQTSDPESLRTFSKAITSNLIGGIGYFYGTSIVDRSFAYEWDQDDDVVVEESNEKKGPTLEPPKGLLTATPSRSFFPRGFYWDEGFHLLHIGEWDNDLSQMYCDVSVNDDDESYHVCHKGYLSLFPFLLSLLPADSPHLGAILDLLRDPAHLWSPYGLRSLSASHPEFGQGENYWKGPIWIQMNYLALSALHKTYAAQEGPHQQRAKEIYAELRRNVVENVHKEYVRTGYVWEQYDALTGEGRRSHPFTGWTSLVTLIISEKYY